MFSDGIADPIAVHRLVKELLSKVICRPNHPFVLSATKMTASGTCGVSTEINSTLLGDHRLAVLMPPACDRVLCSRHSSASKPPTDLPVFHTPTPTLIHLTHSSSVVSHDPSPGAIHVA